MLFIDHSAYGAYGGGSHLACHWILLIYLPSPRPLNQLVPFSTLMLGPKARDSTYLLVLDFNSSIWLAHQTLA